jgi:hypothetical protein
MDILHTLQPMDILHTLQPMDFYTPYNQWTFTHLTTNRLLYTLQPISHLVEPTTLKSKEDN